MRVGPGLCHAAAVEPMRREHRKGWRLAIGTAVTSIEGGSFIGPKMRFSHDTEGEAEFLEFGDQVKVRFEFATYDKSEGKEGRAKVTVKGEAVCPRGDAFR